ncbi:hypothetical protein V1477_011678 [Vespula maculifrons]|uniref:Uncharacterized protein n=1 Tax=Vespula maculifrons TaxID=7453 RepID=A0ABD2BZZ2_VESMC
MLDLAENGKNAETLNNEKKLLASLPRYDPSSPTDWQTSHLMPALKTSLSFVFFYVKSIFSEVPLTSMYLETNSKLDPIRFTIVKGFNKIDESTTSLFRKYRHKSTAGESSTYTFDTYLLVA